jgi:hypothetical protein
MTEQAIRRAPSPARVSGLMVSDLKLAAGYRVASTASPVLRWSRSCSG